MNIFKRLLRIGQAEIHSAVDKMEDPILMTEQGIREMREDLDKALESLAQIKASAIRIRNDRAKKMTAAGDYETKAVILLTRAQQGELSMEQAERLAGDALTLKNSLLAEAQALEGQQINQEKAADELQKNVEILRFNITKWENELKTLRARIRVSRATKEVNKKLAQIDSNSTLSMLERMKEKVEEEEALSKAYGDMAQAVRSVDEEIDKAIGETNNPVGDELAEMKRKLGL